jgi:2,3-bisphosphoglycerate-dependent phosphoglycerate mutase
VLPETLREDGWWSRPFEEPEQVAARVERFLTTLIARHGGTDDRVAVISHGGFYNNMVRVLLKLPDDGTHNWFILNNAAMTRVDIHADGIDWPT